MGAFYNSICLSGDQREKVRPILGRWLTAKGFLRLEGPILFDLDGEHERSAFLVANQHWTVLFYSHYEEERRLIRELQTATAPLLYVWVYDSDVWGFDLFSAHGFAASFSSAPRAHQSFPEEPLGGTRPGVDPATLGALLSLPVPARELGRVAGRRSAFKEDVCREFCRLLGVGAAVSSYDDLESGAVADLAGWQCEQLLFRRDLETLSGEIDLSRHRLTTRQTAVGLVPYEPLELPPGVMAEMERLRRRVRVTYLLLRPVSWIARGWRRLYETSSRLGGGRRVAELPAARPNFRLEGRQLINDRHRCRITLAEGAVPLAVSSKPAAVFGFQLGDLRVTCTARRRSKIDEVMRKPSRSQVLCDEALTIDRHNARHLLFELPPGFVAGMRDCGYLGLYVVETVKALYVFLYRHRTPLAAAAEEAIRATVESFRLLG